MIFLYKDYENFCKKLANNKCLSQTAKEILIKKPGKFLILKHDVETDPKKALEIAKIENKYFHKASYYVHYEIFIKNLNLFKEIQNLGHEVSYHYDVLDKNKGDFIKAKEEFDYHIKEFGKNGFEINTVCQHGNPLVKRIGYNSNRDFFRIFKDKYEIKDIVVNFKEKIGDFIYISDVGYQWQIIPSPESADIKEEKNILIDYDKIISLAKTNSLIVSSHPHRYFKYKLEAELKFFIFEIIKKNAKLIYKTEFGKKIINKFYFLAKKF